MEWSIPFNKDTLLWVTVPYAGTKFFGQTTEVLHVPLGQTLKNRPQGVSLLNRVFVPPKQLLEARSEHTLACHAQSLLDKHRETADGSCHTSAVKQNFSHLPCSPCLHNCKCQYTIHSMVGTHAPAAYSNIAANTTAIPCTRTSHKTFSE